MTSQENMHWSSVLQDILDLMFAGDLLSAAPASLLRTGIKKVWRSLLKQ